MNKKVGIFLIVFGVLVIAGIIYYLFFMNTGINPSSPAEDEKRGALQTDGLKGSEKGGSAAPIKTIVPPKKEISGEEIKKSGLEKIASSFAERLGSFSNQSGFENFKDLEPQMTEAFKAYSEKLKADLEKTHGNYAVFYGINSKALNSVAESYDEKAGQAAVKVMLMREETKGDSVPREYFQDLTLNMALDGKNWKVDRAEWSAERKK
jgi:hypothetical protein